MTNTNKPQTKTYASHIPIDGSRLRQARLSCDLSLEEVSQQVSINKMTLLRYETGDIRTISPERLHRLAQLYQTTPAHLYGISPQQEFLTEDGGQIIPFSADPPSHLGARLEACLRFLSTEKDGH